MASKSKARGKKSTKKAAKKPARVLKADSGKKAASQANKGRMLPDKNLIKNLAAELNRAANRNHQTSEGLKEAKTVAREHGVDVKAVVYVQKLVKMAEENPIGCAVHLENIEYVKEALGLDKLLAKSMFDPKEVRSGKDTKDQTKTEAKAAKANGKKNGNGHAAETQAEQVAEPAPSVAPEHDEAVPESAARH